MAITLELYTFSKKLNSTKQPLGSGTTVSAALKDNTSVLNPTFILKTFDTSKNYIVWGNRYYFVDDIVIISNDHAEYVCRTDVLATYKTVIGTSSQYVVRAASAYDGKIVDMIYPAKADVDYQITNLTQISSAMDTVDGCFILGIKNKYSTAGAAFYALTESEFLTFLAYLYSDLWLDATDISSALQKMLIDPFDYIVSCNWFPIKVADIPGTAGSQLWFGYWQATGCTGKKIANSGRIKSFTHSGTLPDHPQLTRGSYLNSAHYTQLMVDLYAFGRFMLNPDKFLTSRSFSVLISFDLYTGTGTCKVESTEGPVYMASATCCVPVQISQVKNDLIRPLISSASAGVALATQNYIGAAASIADAVTSGFPQIESQGAIGSVTAYAYNPPKIGAFFYKIVDEDLAQIGRPLCQVKTISTLSGYIKCEEADLDSAGSATEKEMIISYMNSGFYYE